MKKWDSERAGRKGLKEGRKEGKGRKERRQMDERKKCSFLSP